MRDCVVAAALQPVACYMVVGCLLQWSTASMFLSVAPNKEWFVVAAEQDLSAKGLLPVTSDRYELDIHAMLNKMPRSFKTTCVCNCCSATQAAAAQKEAEDAHEQYDRSKGQLRILEEEQLRAEEAKEQVEQSLQALASREAEMAQLQTYVLSFSSNVCSMHVLALSHFLSTLRMYICKISDHTVPDCTTREGEVFD